MKNKKKEVKQKLPISFIGQIILVVISLLLALVSIWIPIFLLYFEISLIFLLFLVAYNNELIYKRGYMTFVYIAVAVILLILVILEMIQSVVPVY